LATARIPIESEYTFDEAMAALSREERFMATVQAMNTLLIQKGVYSSEEFEELVIDWAKCQFDRPLNERPGWRR
jgi:hypothetical protein